MSARQHVRTLRAVDAARGAADGDALVRDHERAEQAIQVIDAALDDPAQLVGVVGTGVGGIGGAVRGDREQQVEVLVAGLQMPTELADVLLRDQLALQALERRAQQAVHERPRTRRAAVAAAGHGQDSEQLAGFLAQAEQVDRRVLVDLREDTFLGAGLRQAGAIHQRLQVGAVDVTAGEALHAVHVEDVDAGSARQQHLDELAVGLERICEALSDRCGSCADMARLDTARDRPRPLLDSRGANNPSGEVPGL